MTQWKWDYPPIHEPHTASTITAALNKGANIMLKQIYRLLIPHKKSGDLLLSWGVTPSAGEGDPVVIYSEDPASIYLDRGAPPHDILPKNGKILTFEVAATGTGFRGEALDSGETDTVATQRVHHPGFKGIRYIEQAETESYVERTNLLRLAVEESIQEIFTGTLDLGLFDFEAVTPGTFASGPRAGQTFFTRPTGRGRQRVFAKKPAGFRRGPR